MIQAIIEGEQNPGLLADRAKGLLRHKIRELQALAGWITTPHRCLLAPRRDDLRHAEAKRERVRRSSATHSLWVRMSPDWAPFRAWIG